MVTLGKFYKRPNRKDTEKDVLFSKFVIVFSIGMSRTKKKSIFIQDFH